MPQNYVHHSYICIETSFVLFFLEGGRLSRRCASCRLSPQRFRRSFALPNAPPLRAASSALFRCDFDCIFLIFDRNMAAAAALSDAALDERLAQFQVESA